MKILTTFFITETTEEGEIQLSSTQQFNSKNTPFMIEIEFDIFLKEGRKVVLKSWTQGDEDVVILKSFN